MFLQLRRFNTSILILLLLFLTSLPSSLPQTTFSPASDYTSGGRDTGGGQGASPTPSELLRAFAASALLGPWCPPWTVMRNAAPVVAFSWQILGWVILTPGWKRAEVTNRKWSFLLILSTKTGFPSAQLVKNLPANAGDARDTGSIPGFGRCPGEGNGNPLQYSCLGESHGQRSLAGYRPWDLKKLDMTEHCTPPQQWKLKTGRWKGPRETRYSVGKYSAVSASPSPEERMLCWPNSSVGLRATTICN